ncbi:phage tail sheath protein [Clostridium botulinum]|uniref:phage tail sheath family protein n=1 Tax=Clostridium botulinum TaxID=1491 RepID=UPI0013C74D79|nr:phage tail sheath family protein [Clostridium botulinum]MBY6879659.1 phage tail sheath subtilisin-like domain-containing protein [Clostridium botulinum]NFB02782.1 phage tail sheath protein [Clostridium botulinum]NFE32711.1 phage tail sheath protein [Clostridium botulinum]WCJ72087.1 phage tail sheath family protein [Clostridium botulinum]WCJ75926.1 phage tail sheath family protein [Clostridium botulinum]
MAGGTWERQNKIRPGAYINFKSKKQGQTPIGERGIATLPLELPWGPEKEIITIHADDDLSKVLGINIADESALLIREVLKKAKILLLYRLNEGTKATAALEGLTINAKYTGTKGNNITVIIQNSIDFTGSFEVITRFEGNKVDKQLVKTIEDLKDNDYVDFKGTGELKTSAGLPLKGGADGTVTNQGYTDYLSVIEPYEFHAMGIPTKDPTIKAVATTFIKRLKEDGRQVQLILENYPEADSENVITVKNGVILADNTVIKSNQAVAFVTGATAGANVNQSNTYLEYPGAIDVDTKYTNREIEEALLNGEIVFTISNRRVVIEQDINTFKSFTEDKGKDYRKNRVVRTLFEVNNGTRLLWETSYIGKGDNSEDGRNLYKKDVIKFLEKLQGIGALENVVPEDVEIKRGQDKESVVARVGVQAIDAMEKLYMDVEVE